MKAACIVTKVMVYGKEREKLVVYVNKMCFGNSVYRAPRSRFFPGKTARAPGGQDPGSLQIKENDVYMREGCCSSYDPSEGESAR